MWQSIWSHLLVQHTRDAEQSAHPLANFEAGIYLFVSAGQAESFPVKVTFTVVVQDLEKQWWPISEAGSTCRKDKWLCMERFVWQGREQPWDLAQLQLKPLASPGRAAEPGDDCQSSSAAQTQQSLGQQFPTHFCCLEKWECSRQRECCTIKKITAWCCPGLVSPFN